jgi:putative DNA primase/helicase
MNEIEEARSALNFLSAECSREEWIQLGMAIKSAGLSFDDFHEWSKHASNYGGEKDCRTVWKSFNESGGITKATLFSFAHDKGWRPAKYTARIKDSKTASTTKIITNLKALDIWERCLPAQDSHEYVMRKHGKTDGLRYYPSTEPRLTICGQDVTEHLVVPCWNGEHLQTLQFIPPRGGKKLNLPAASFNDGYFITGNNVDLIYLCEGIGQSWAINKIDNATAAVSFGFGRMQMIAETLRNKHPNAKIIIVPDRGKEKQAAEIAKSVMGHWIELPQEKPSNYDINDYLLEHGIEALQALLTSSKFDMPLDVFFADTIPDEFSPPDELVEGLLIAGDTSILYGNSNSGKTFFVIDLACAIARGIDWMGRKTEPGLVIYLAAESPVSVQRRLQAYQKYYRTRVPNFAVVRSPINFFETEADMEAVIQLVAVLEKQYGQKARLIVGDTLARISAGANENAGQDMGLVVRRLDYIRNACNTHFMLIHHSGKNTAAGARGWSGIRAAVDTEIEITDSLEGRCAEITKQRDLNSKGIRIGFKLEVIELGLTKWKSPATSCIVVPVDAPQKSPNKRVSEVGGAILEYLRSTNAPIPKKVVAKHFDDLYKSSSVYRQIQKLVQAGVVAEADGNVTLVPTSTD